jgi:hypothetical protein
MVSPLNREGSRHTLEKHDVTSRAGKQEAKHHAGWAIAAGSHGTLTVSSDSSM